MTRHWKPAYNKILRALAGKISMKEIAEAMNFTVGTVHKNSIKNGINLSLSDNKPMSREARGRIIELRRLGFSHRKIADSTNIKHGRIEYFLRQNYNEAPLPY